jgi:hypothetical protein
MKEVDGMNHEIENILNIEKIIKYEKEFYIKLDNLKNSKDLKSVNEDKNNEEYQDKYLRLTRELLQNYNNFKKVSIEGLCEIVYNGTEFNSLINIQDILSSKKASKIIYKHIRCAINTTRSILIEKDDVGKLRATELKYFHNKSYDDLAKQFHCDKATIVRWIDKVIEDLSVLLFGIYALNLRL